MRIPNIISLVLAILTLTLPAQRPHDPLAAALDQDRNGELSAQEIRLAPSRLRALDRDGNGMLEEREILKKPPKREDSEFSAEAFVNRVLKHDLNNDGRVTREELPKGLVRLLDQTDSNQDDALSRTELESTVKRLHDRNRKD